MNEWIDELSDLMAGGQRAVLVTVLAVRGSAPREVGAKMIVTHNETIGTIGGGQLEYQCARIAAGRLEQADGIERQSFPLGSSLGQCCGGVVDVLFESMTAGLPPWLNALRAMHGQRLPAVLSTHLHGDAAGEKSVVDGDSAQALLQRSRRARIENDVLLEPVIASDLNIAVFGAGHVGSAVVQTLSALDCNIRWIDSRRNVFRRLPRNVRAIESDNPSLEVAAMPVASCYLVMTHSHAIDFDVCDRILRRGDALYCGLIGSRSKRRRFEKRFRQQDMPATLLEQLVCPIGVDGITGKKPAEIAVAAAAEVLQVFESAAAPSNIEYPANVHPLNNNGLA